VVRPQLPAASALVGETEVIAVGGSGGADEHAGLSLVAELVAKALNGP